MSQISSSLATVKEKLKFPVLGFIGIANALPISLAGSTLAIWLTELGFEKATIGWLAFLSIPFSLKLLWAPVIDHVVLPFCGSCPRKGWILFSFWGMAFSLLGLGLTNPEESFCGFLGCVFSLSLFSGCLFIVGLAYELESMEEDEYSLGSAWVLTGYRLGLLCSGAGALYFSSLWGWRFAYCCMSGLIFLGSAFVFFLPEPYKTFCVLQAKRQTWQQYRSLYQGFWREIIVEPGRLFFSRPDWLIVILVLIGFKVGDQMIKTMEGIFFLSLGFDKVDIATASKVWGLSATIIGAFCSGLIFKGRNALRSLGAVGLLHASTLFCHFLLAINGKSFFVFYIIVAIENFTSGMAMTAFISFLWSICDKRYAALQYALLWSLYLFKTDVLTWAGAMLASQFSWDIFFLIVSSGGFGIALVSCCLLIQAQKQTLAVK